jgi:hypothetical protein
MNHVVQVFAQTLVPQTPANPSVIDGHSAAIALMVLLGLIGLAVFGVLYYRKRNLTSTVDERFRAFRAQAVSLMEQLDALRKRHRTLPSTDPDFTAPMTGETKALYESVDHDLDRLWDRWLKVMEIWDTAQKRIGAGGGFALGPTEEARKLLEGGEIDELVRESAHCKDRLDQLNQAHEVARENLGEARAELARIQNALTKGTGVLLPTDPFHGEVQAAETSLHEAETILTPDPIRAQNLITRAHESLAKLEAGPERGLPKRKEAPSYAYPIIEELMAAVERLKAGIASLGLTGILMLFVRAWIFVWVAGLLLGVLTSLMPLIILLVCFALVGIGGMMVVRSMASWLLFGGQRKHLRKR